MAAEGQQEEGAELRIWVAYSPAAREVVEVALTLPAGATLAQALQASGLPQRYPELGAGTLAVGIWGRKATLQQALRDQDRVEIYRPLQVDPKVARRERFVRQGVRTAGLFARRRPGAKPGY
jgi:putative ubiquitin-RnfH superfamily antitoxin RatB of RatAB toxin-antitoxin module